MARKLGLTVDQHRDLGVKLKAMRSELLPLVVLVSKVYPKQAKASRDLIRALNTLDQARSELDGQMCREHPAEFSPEFTIRAIWSAKESRRD